MVGQELVDTAMAAGGELPEDVDQVRVARHPGARRSQPPRAAAGGGGGSGTRAYLYSCFTVLQLAFDTETVQPTGPAPIRPHDSAPGGW